MNTMTDSIQWMRRHADMECDRMLERIDTLKKDVASYIEHYRTDICPFKTGTAYDIDVTGKDAGHKAGYRFAGADTETGISGRHVMLTFISPDEKEHVYRASDVAGSCSDYTDMMVRCLWHDACACQDALDDISQNIYEHITEYRKGCHVSLMTHGRWMTDIIIDKVSYDVSPRSYGRHRLMFSFRRPVTICLTEDEITGMTVL